MRYAKVQGHNVFLMDKVKTKEGYIAVQALRNGETAIVKRNTNQNRHTAFDWAIKNGYLKEEDRFNHELIRNTWFFSQPKDVLKRDL